MSVLVATSLPEALDLLAKHPNAHILAGGTDFMVEVNFRHRDPHVVVAVGRIPELQRWSRNDNTITIGAGVTYAAMEHSGLATLVPALAQAARTVGSPQIRNAGTLGGNLGTGSPAGDTLPVLAALDANVIVASANGQRSQPVTQFVSGVKRTTLEPGELIAGVEVPVLDGPQEYLKIGTRNAMVISVAGLALITHTPDQQVRVGLGAVNAVPTRATEAEAWVTNQIDWSTMSLTAPNTAEEFGALVASASNPIDDHRSSANYRRHGVAVMAKRALVRAFPGEVHA